MNGITDILVVTQEDVDTKARIFVEERNAVVYIKAGAAKHYEVMQVVQEAIVEPLWKQYITRVGANTKAETAYLRDLCEKLGAEDADTLMRADMRAILEDAEKLRPSVLEGVINGTVNLSVNVDEKDAFEAITNGEDDTFDYENIIGG